MDEPLDPNEPIPQEKTHLHFGAGPTKARNWVDRRRLKLVTRATIPSRACHSD
jgi:hypothetical protein